MSTRAYAFRQNPDGTVTGIYIHGDGYPSHTGVLLRDYYSKPEQVDALIALGDLSFLDVSIEKPEGHSFDNRVDGYTVAYHRDRGESWGEVEPRSFSGIDEAQKWCSGIDYVYLWTDVAGWRCVGKWGRPLDVIIPAKQG